MKKEQNDTLYYILGAILLFIILILSYYILVNTTLKKRVLPNTQINGQNISLYTDEDLEKYFSENIQPSIPSTIEVRMDNFNYYVPTKHLDIKFRTDEILSYGKGNDFVDTMVKGVTTFRGHNLTSDLTLTPQAIIEAHPYSFNTLESAFISETGEINNCKYNNFRIDFNYDVLEDLALNAVKNNTTITTSIQDITIDPSQTRIIYYCDIYREELHKIKSSFEDFPGISDFPASEIFSLYETQNGPEWKIQNRTLLSNELSKYKKLTDIEYKQGEVEYVDNKALILAHAQNGRFLDIHDTISNIEVWLSNLSEYPNFDYELVESNEYLGAQDTLDFTKLVASGKTRIDLIRDGAWNWVVPIAQAGVEELHNTIIYPGEEFSFINHVQPRDDNILVMASGRPLGGGTCNSTTTLFRAVLEAGLPVTERFSHTFYVDSYAWGDYPLNIVDATYYYQPNVDLKFVNDYDYPILLKSRIYKGNDGYQYHTIDIYSNQNASDREVTLSNWQKYNVITPRKFTGSFDRIVKENGQVIHADKFISRYGDPVEY